MKSYIEITGKYLKGQKKRSVLTVVGIILSVALITGIGTIFLSMYDANVRNTIKNNGDYYAAIPAVSGDQAGLLSNNVSTQKLGVSQRVGFAAYAANKKNGIDTPYKYLNVLAFDDSAQKMQPFYDLQDGRLPQAVGEIALDYWTLKYMPGVKIGDTITLNLGTRTLAGGVVTDDPANSSPDETFTKVESKTYILVGTLKPPFVSQLNFARAVTFLDGKNLSKAQQYTVYIKLKSVNNAQKQIDDMATAVGLHTSKGEANAIQFNDRVLRLYAQSINEMFNSSLITIICIVVALVVISTIAVIYNAFNISVVERVSQFGLLRCVGGTPQQIKKIVFREALILGSIGIPIGIVCGTLAMGIVFSIISTIASNMVLGGLRLIFSPYLILVSVLVGALTIYLSALLPARKAAKISPMEAVRGTGAFKKEKYRKTDKHRFVLALLGAEGWMAWKNLGRNRKRFYITVLSMVISIVLFIVFSSLVGYAFQSGAVDTSDKPSYMIYPNNTSDKLDINASGLDNLAAIKGVDYVLAYSDLYAEATVPAKKLDTRAAELLNQSGIQADAQGNYLLFNSNIVCYQDNEIDRIIKQLNLGSFDADAFRRGEGVILINGGDFVDTKAAKHVLTDVTTLKQGDKFQVDGYSPADENSNKITKQLGILAVVEQGLPGYARNQASGVYIIASEKLVREMAPWVNIPERVMVMMKPGTDHTAAKTFISNLMDQNPGFGLEDMDDMAKSFSQTWMVMSIFLYGFVAVISLIGSLNIINTISTNIIVRTRELSVMRAIGMSDGGVRKMIALESILHGAAAALIGSVVGTGLSWLLYNTMSNIREFPWQIPWVQILIAVGASALVAVISGFVPLKRISKGVIMEGIRGEE